MPFVSTRDLKEDVLFRGSEPITGSDWDTKVIDYLNRCYSALCAGASEFLPEYVDDWWWMRAKGSFLLEPVNNTGGVTIAYGSQNGTFTVAPSTSMAGRRLRVTDCTELAVIETHTAGATAFTIDQPWTNDSVTAQSFMAMLTDYTLDVEVQAVLSPMVTYQSTNRIMGLSPERFDELNPATGLTSGIPTHFSLEDENRIRFNTGGRIDGQAMRIDYRYRPHVDLLEDTTLSIPLVPVQWRHVLCDMALTYLFLDKNDDRSNATALGARTNLGGMLKENRRRLTKIDASAGHITPRLAGLKTKLGPRLGRL